MVTTSDGGAPHSHVSLVTKSSLVLLGMIALINLYSTQSIFGQNATWALIPTTNVAWTISTMTADVAITASFAGMSDRIGRRRVLC